MIFHASIPADDPQKVAQAVAEIWGGEASQFPPWPGAYVAIAGDDRGSTLEIYPCERPLTPGEQDLPAKPGLDGSPSQYLACHIATQTSKSEDEILAIGRREGWRTLRCNRGNLFDVIELWIENRLLLEVLTPDMQKDYKKSIKMDMWKR